MLNICVPCWQACKQINGTQPQASLPSQASSLTTKSQRLVPPSHHVAALRLGSSLIQGYVIPMNCRLCSCMESQQGNMLAFRKTILCEKEGLGGNNVRVSSVSWKQSQLLAAQWHAGRSFESFPVTEDSCVPGLETSGHKNGLYSIRMQEDYRAPHADQPWPSREWWLKLSFSFLGTGC